MDGENNQNGVLQENSEQPITAEAPMAEQTAVEETKVNEPQTASVVSEGSVASSKPSLFAKILQILKIRK